MATDKYRGYIVEDDREGDSDNFHRNIIKRPDGTIVARGIYDYNLMSIINELPALTPRGTTNMTKYYHRTAKPLNQEQEPWVEIPLNRDNWWYVQLDGSIRTAFFRYGLPDPEMVIVEDSIPREGVVPVVNIMVVRPPLRTLDGFNLWREKKLYVESELKRQADANSDDYEGVVYTIKVI